MRRDEHPSASPPSTIRLGSQPRPIPEPPFLLVFDDSSATRFPLPVRGKVLIGRSSDADLHLKSSSVSRRHALLHVEDGDVFIEDLRSQNGVRVNGRRVSDKTALAPHDVLAIGAVTAVFDGCGAPGGAARGARVERAALPAPAIADLADPAAAPMRIELPNVRILVADPGMRRVYALIEQLAAVDLPVLLGGETGTGKELAAAAVHHWSRRRERPFVAMNCAALPEGLVETELFGATKGAYSGAVAKPGLFEEAHGGTLFLDEIGELPLGAQAKLLRVLETHRVRRVGAVKEREVELRIVAASHRDLEDEVRQGRFREDLYFRVSAATVRLPPLRARPCEIPLLAQELLERACHQFGRNGLTLSPAAMSALVGYRWPGNVRELKNVIEYAAATARLSVIHREDLPERVQPPDRGASGGNGSKESAGGLPPLEGEMRELEKERILAALDACNGNQTRAAKLIQMSRRTFIDKIRRYGLTQRRTYR